MMNTTRKIEGYEITSLSIPIYITGWDCCVIRQKDRNNITSLVGF
jgi:hypothetical protein